MTSFGSNRKFSGTVIAISCLAIIVAIQIVKHSYKNEIRLDEEPIGSRINGERKTLDTDDDVIDDPIIVNDQIVLEVDPSITDPQNDSEVRTIATKGEVFKRIITFISYSCRE